MGGGAGGERCYVGQAAVAGGFVDDDAYAVVVDADDGGGVGVAALDEAAQAVAETGVDLAEVLAAAGVDVEGVMLLAEGDRVAGGYGAEGYAAGGVAQGGGGGFAAFADEQLGRAGGLAGALVGRGGGVAHLLQAGAVFAGDVVVGGDPADAVKNLTGFGVFAQLDQGFGEAVEGFGVIGKQLQEGAVYLGRAFPFAL